MRRHSKALSFGVATVGLKGNACHALTACQLINVFSKKINIHVTSDNPSKKSLLIILAWISWFCFAVR